MALLTPAEARVAAGSTAGTALLLVAVALAGVQCGSGQASRDAAPPAPDAAPECVRDQDCSDDKLCTDDSCGDNGSCRFTNNSVSCDDGDACTDADRCTGGVCGGTVESCCDDDINNDGDEFTDCEDSDCSDLTICAGTCPGVSSPDPVGDSVLPNQSTGNRTETTTTNGFTDDYLYNGDETMKIGSRREWGGTIIFFGMTNGSPGTNPTNTIDANDTGREVQVAFYDPDRQMQDCAHDASCATTGTNCTFSITYLGWNPVQGGNRCNNGSGTDNVDLAGGAIDITTTPLFWNPNWDRDDCVDAACDNAALNMRRSDVKVIQRMRFVRTHVAELDYTIINLADVDHRATLQELPTVYTGNGNQGPDLWRLFNSAGTEIDIDTPGNDGFFFENFSSADGWVTMQNQTLDYGVGMYNENKLTAWQGWQNRDLPFNNFRAQFSFGIPGLATVRARAYLIIGANTLVANEAQWLDANLAAFGVLDAPAADAAVSSVVAVHGWALDNKGVASIDLIIDGTTTIPLTYGTDRADVCEVWPGYALCPAVGYQGSFDSATLSACPHLLEIRATDGDGNQRVIARRRIYVGE